MGVWGVVNFVLSVMRVIGGVPLWVVCVSSCVYCTLSCYSECGVLCYL